MAERRSFQLFVSDCVRVWKRWKRHVLPYRYWMTNGPVLDAVPILARQRSWEGTATELLDELARIVPRQALPASASRLSGELRGWADVLEDLGVRVTFTRRVE